jgi:iron complex transport system substrate-binding protein
MVGSNQSFAEEFLEEIPRFNDPPERVISLVPSITESMFDLGLGEHLVGITDYCIHPHDAVANLSRLGGTKNPSVSKIIDLQPDLVLANWEENTRDAVEELRQAGLVVWVTFPHSVSESIRDLFSLVAIFKSQTARLRVQILEHTLEWTISACENRPPMRYFCPIWYDRTQSGLHWWMTFNRNTYSHDLLRIFACENAFADRQRRYPLEADLGIIAAKSFPQADTRYPRVGLQEILASKIELILLPSEPFAFEKSHVDLLSHLLSDTPAVRDGWIVPVDGTLITWHGTHLAKSLRVLPGMLDSYYRS